jgi:hypothetical protein
VALPVVAAIVVYLTTFAACCVMFRLWGLRHVADTAAVIALVPALIAYAVMLG